MRISRPIWSYTDYQSPDGCYEKKICVGVVFPLFTGFVVRLHDLREIWLGIGPFFFLFAFESPGSIWPGRRLSVLFRVMDLGIGHGNDCLIEAPKGRYGWWNWSARTLKETGYRRRPWGYMIKGPISISRSGTASTSMQARSSKMVEHQHECFVTFRHDMGYCECACGARRLKGEWEMPDET